VQIYLGWYDQQQSTKVQIRRNNYRKFGQGVYGQYGRSQNFGKPCAMTPRASLSDLAKLPCGCRALNGARRDWRGLQQNGEILGFYRVTCRSDGQGDPVPRFE